jgi:hypothetical protein
MATPSVLDDIEWRRLHKRLWVARQDGVPLGMIERGRRFRVTDADDIERGSYRTFDAAKTALLRDTTGSTPCPTAAVPATLIIASGLVAVAATVFAGWGLLLLT